MEITNKKDDSLKRGEQKRVDHFDNKGVIRKADFFFTENKPESARIPDTRCWIPI